MLHHSGGGCGPRRGNPHRERINPSRYATLWRSSCTSSMSLTTSSLRCSRVPSPAPAASCAASCASSGSPAPAASCAAVSLSLAQAVHLICASGRCLSDLALFWQQPLPWPAQISQSLHPWHWQYGVGSSTETDDILVPVRSKNAPPSCDAFS